MVVLNNISLSNDLLLLCGTVVTDEHNNGIVSAHVGCSCPSSLLLLRASNVDAVNDKLTCVVPIIIGLILSSRYKMYQF